MQMRNRHNHDGVAVHPEYETIGKPCEQAASKPWLYLHCRERIDNYSSNDPV